MKLINIVVNENKEAQRSSTCTHHKGRDLPIPMEFSPGKNKVLPKMMQISGGKESLVTSTKMIQQHPVTRIACKAIYLILQ